MILPLLLSIVLEVLARVIRQDKERHPNWKGRSETHYLLMIEIAWMIEVDDMNAFLKK